MSSGTEEAGNSTRPEGKILAETATGTAAAGATTAVATATTTTATRPF